MAKTTIPGGYIADNAIAGNHITDNSITSDHLHTTLDLSSKTLTIGAATVAGHLIPDTNITYDLGSSSNRFRDIYLDTGTIHMGTDTKITIASNGELEIKDSSDDLKRIRVKELEFEDGAGRVKRFAIDPTSQKIKTFDRDGLTLTADKIDLGASDTDDLSEGSSNLYFTNERVDDRVNTLLTAGTGITLTYDDANNTLTVAGAAQYGDSDVESYLSGGTGVTFSSGVISIGQDVGTSATPTFGNTIVGTLQATSFSDGTISGITFIDEDSFATNSATRVPTQQSVKAYVDAEVAGVVDSAPAALNTLNELAAALGDDANFSTTTSTALGNRLRVDTASQGLTGTQQANAITNLGITATKAELNFVDGVTSNIQTQLNTKITSSDNITGTSGGLSGTPNITVGTISSGAITSTGTITTSDIASTGDIDIKPAAGSDALFFNAHNSESELRLFNNRQDLSDVPVSSIVGYNNVQVSKIQFYRGGGGSSGYINFQVKPQNAESLTDTFQIGDSNTVGYGVNVRAGGYRVGGTTVIDSTRNLTNIGTISSKTILISSATGTYQAGSLGFTDSNWGFLYRPPQAGAQGAHLFESYDGTNLVTIEESGNATFAGTVSATEYHISGTEVLDHDGNYTTLLDPTAHVGLFLGGTGDPGNYYDNNTHYFRTRGDAEQVVIDSTKLNIVTGALQINGTAVIDTSRNLTNIGTISSGAITTSTKITQTSSGELLRNSISSWGGNSEHDILYNGWNSTISDYLIVKNSGNGSVDGAIVISDSVFAYGGHQATGGAAASLTAPLSSSNAFTVTSSGNANFSGNVTATAFYGDGSNLTGISGSGGGVTISNNANNRVLTGDGTNANAESNLTFDGSTLSVTGTISSGAISANSGAGINEFYSAHTSSGDDWAVSPISIRERGKVTNTQSADSYSPNINFHWGDRVSRSLTMKADGNFILGEWSSGGSPNTTSGLSNLNLDSININGTGVIDSSRNLTNIGTISSGKITTSGTGTAGAPTLDIINSSSSTFNHTIEAMTPNLTANESNILVFGRASSTKNSGYIGYRYSGTAGSNDNVVTIGHWGSDHLVTINGVGNTTFAGTVTGTTFQASGADSTPLGTTFANTIKGVDTNRTIYFDGSSGSVSTWYGVGDNAYAAIDCTDGVMDFWSNDSSGTWRNIFNINPAGLEIETGRVYSSISTGLRLGSFSTSNADETGSAVVTFLRGSGYDEYIIKGSTSRGVFGRQFIGPHFSNSHSWGVFSSGWDTHFQISGDDRIYMKPNVGIGTASPQADFQVIGPASASVPSAGVGAVGGAIFSADLNSYGMFVGSITNGNGYIQQQRTDSATYYNLLLQPNGGSVAIGTSSITAKLNIGGNVDTGNVFLAGSDSGNYNEGIRLRNAANNHAVIAFGASGNSGTPTWSFLKMPDSSFQIRRAGTVMMTLANSTSDANMIVRGNITAYGSPSDIRLKENIATIENPLDKVAQLRGITFDYKKDGKRSTGLIAQELEKVLPEAVYETSDIDNKDDKFKAVRYGNVVGLLVEAIKEQQKEIEQLKKHSHPAKDMCDMNGYQELMARIEKMEKNYGNN